MRLQSLALLAGASIVAADSTTTLFLPGFDAQSLDAKVLGSDPPMTTYLLNCPPGEDSTECGLPPDGYTVTAGPSTLIMGFHYNEVSVSQSCSFQGTTFADCVVTMTSDGSTAAMTSAIDIASIPYGGYMPVHITATETAGASASTGASASPTTASPTTTLAKGTTTLTGTVTSTSSASAASASTSDSSNAAMPMVTGHARWVVGGAAALALAVV